jgi:hypothetical protein
LYFLLVIVFLIFHNWHTYLIYFRTHWIKMRSTIDKFPYHNFEFQVVF